MNRACSTLTQKPSARIVDGSSTCSATCCDDEPRPGVVRSCRRCVERVDVVAAAAPPRDLAQVERRRGCRSRRTARGAAGRSRPTAAARRRCGRRTSAARRGRRCARASRSGRAARRAATCSSSALVRRRGGVVELVDDHDVEVVRVERARRRARCRLWIDAKTWSNRVGRCAADPLLAERRRRAARGGTSRGSGRGSPRGGRRTAGATAAAPSRSARSRPPPSRSCRCRWRRRAGCGGGPAGGRASICSSSRSWNGRRPSSIGLRITCGPRSAAGAFARRRTRRRRTARSRRSPSSSRRPRRSWRSRPGCGPPRRGRSTPAR